MGTFGQSHAVAFGDHVVVITLEAAMGDSDAGSEVMQLLIGTIADHV